MKTKTSEIKSASPNWEQRKIIAERLLSSQQIEGFPFSEGIPDNRSGMFEIILRDGSISKATLDTSRQYAAEGIQWQSGSTTWPKSCVAAWKEI